MEDVTAMYYEKTFFKRFGQVNVETIQKVVYSGSGMVTGNLDISKMVNSFMEANKDMISMIIAKSSNDTDVSLRINNV